MDLILSVFFSILCSFNQVSAYRQRESELHSQLHLARELLAQARQTQVVAQEKLLDKTETEGTDFLFRLLSSGNRLCCPTNRCEETGAGERAAASAGGLRKTVWRNACLEA